MWLFNNTIQFSPIVCFHTEHKVFFLLLSENGFGNLSLVPINIFGMLIQARLKFAKDCMLLICVTMNEKLIFVLSFFCREALKHSYESTSGCANVTIIYLLTTKLTWRWL